MGWTEQMQDMIIVADCCDHDKEQLVTLMSPVASSVRTCALWSHLALHVVITEF